MVTIPSMGSNVRRLWFTVTTGSPARPMGSKMMAAAVSMS
jgi:hypothetical protein